MRYSLLSAAVALVSFVSAQTPTPNFNAISSPTLDQTVAAGSTLTIDWDPTGYTNGTVTITLLQGATPSTLSVGQVVKAGIENAIGKFDWVIPTTLGSFATYGFTISLDADPKIFQYSFPFHITPSSGSSSTGKASESVSTYPASDLSTKTVQLSTGTAYTVSSLSTAVPTKSNTTTMEAPKSTYATSNGTLATTGRPTPSSTSGPAAAATSSGAPAQTANAAPGNFVTGGFAMLGGLALALAL